VEPERLSGTTAVAGAMAQSPSLAAEDTKRCPDCAERVKRDARVCRSCGYRFDQANPERPTA
jgi:predicted amidophosphoribosyltransferase